MARRPEFLVKPLQGDVFHIPLKKDITSIGRSWWNDLTLADSWLDRRHAKIRAEGDRYLIEDLGSRNGTYVNGHRINGAVALQNADIIQVGDQQMKFFHDASGRVFLEEEWGHREGTVVVPASALLAAARDQNIECDDLDVLDALIREYPLNQVFELILKRATDRAKADRGVLMIANDGEFVPRAVRTGESDEEIRFARALANKVMTEKVSILMSNALSDPAHDRPFVSVRIRSAMCVPLWDERNAMGLIYVDSGRRGNSFGQDDLTLLTCLANLAAIKLKTVTRLK